MYVKTGRGRARSVLNLPRPKVYFTLDSRAVMIPITTTRRVFASGLMRGHCARYPDFAGACTADEW